MDYAAAIKERVSTPELFSFYGFKRNRGGFINCPFHGEKTGSMKIYDGARGYHCFGGCGAHGDIIDFVAAYFNLSFMDAQRKINEDFHLGLPIDGKLSKEQRRQNEIAQRERREKRLAEQREHDNILKACEQASSEWIRLDAQRRLFAPRNDAEELHPLFVEALQKMDYASYLWDAAEDARYKYELKHKA